ncbi:MAG: SPOR domain-containing protein, partial [Kiloniellales bacterium]
GASTAEVPAIPAEPAPAVKTADGGSAGDKSAEDKATEGKAGDTQAAQPTPPPDVAPSAGGKAAASVAGGGAGSTSTTGGEGAGAPLQLAAVKQGDYVIQLASVTSDEAAKTEWARLQKAFPELLGDMNLSPQVATVKGTEYHRVQTGPFPSRATAIDLCAQLQAKNQACIVQQR